jgi:hypothetical protein
MTVAGGSVITGAGGFVTIGAGGSVTRGAAGALTTGADALLIVKDELEFQFVSTPDALLPLTCHVYVPGHIWPM